MFVASRLMMGAAGGSVSAPALATYLETVQADSPAAVWLLDGDATDELGANDATEIGAPSYAAAPWGGDAVLIDDDPEAVRAPPVLGNGNVRPYTLEAWAVPQARPALRGMVCTQRSSSGSNANTGLQLNPAGTVRSDKYPPSGGETDSGQVLTLGLPYHLALTEEAGALRIYINGEQVAEDATPETYAGDAMEYFWIGNTVTVNRPAEALLGRAAAYAVALTPARLRRHYYIGAGLTHYIYPQQPIGWALAGLGGAL
jgi:hypothetical protein